MGKHKEWNKTARRTLTDKLRPNETLYLACQNMELGWYKEEIDIVNKAWKDGLPLWEIASKLKRPEEEVLILLIDIKPNLRKGWVYGSQEATI